VYTFFIINKVQNIEGQYALKFNNLKALSVEQVVDCDGTTDKITIHSDCGVYGGWPFLAFQYIQNAVSIYL
jgi:cathepsin F